jgi:hypothetical protein
MGTDLHQRAGSHQRPGKDVLEPRSGTFDRESGGRSVIKLDKKLGTAMVRHLIKNGKVGPKASLIHMFPLPDRDSYYAIGIVIKDGTEYKAFTEESDMPYDEPRLAQASKKELAAMIRIAQDSLFMVTKAYVLMCEKRNKS